MSIASRNININININITSNASGIVAAANQTQKVVNRVCQGFSATVADSNLANGVVYNFGNTVQKTQGKLRRFGQGVVDATIDMILPD